MRKSTCAILGGGAVEEVEEVGYGSRTAEGLANSRKPDHPIERRRHVEARRPSAEGSVQRRQPDRPLGWWGYVQVNANSICAFGGACVRGASAGARPW